MVKVEENQKGSNQKCCLTRKGEKKGQSGYILFYTEF